MCAGKGNMVRCTVAIPTYNREDMIRGTLESVLAQDIHDLEILVVDDQSKDRVFEIAVSYKDSRLRVVRNETNVGLFGNFNRCVELSSGPLLRILCNDDRLAKDCLRRELEVMEANPEISLLFSKGLRFTKAGVPLGPVGDHFRPGLYDGREAVHAILWFLAHYGINPMTLPSGVLMRKSACAEAGWFDESMRMDGDLDYFLRVIERGDLAVLDDVGCTISIHEQQMSSVLNGDPAIVQEHFTVARRHAECLAGRGSLSRINEQLSALAFLFALHQRWNGRTQQALAHREMAFRHCPSRVRLLLAVVRLIGLRAMLKGLGVRRVPARPRSLA